MSTYYVNASTGSDSNPGSVGLPWATIPHADTVVAPGDTVIVIGTYPIATTAMRTNASGTPGHPITYTSQVTRPWLTPGGAQNAILSSTVPYTATEPWVWDVRGSYVNIVGFEVTGVNTPVGIDLNGGSHCRVLNNYIHDLGTSVPNTQPGAAIFDAGLNGSSYNEIGFNWINNIGIQTTGGNQFTHGIYPSGSYDFVHHNVIGNCSGWGIHALGDSYLGGCCMHHCIVANNTCFQNAYGGLVFASGDSSTADFMYAVNNLMVFNGKLGVSGWGIKEAPNTGPNSLYANNQTYGNTAGSYSLLNGLVATSQVTTAPTLRHYLTNGTGDYHPLPPSTSIDAGTPALPTWNTTWAYSTDLDGVSVPQGPGYDIGAYEWVPIAALPTPALPYPPPGVPPVGGPAPARFPYSRSLYTGTGSPSDTPSDVTRYKTQMAFVYTAGGAFLDVWRDAPLLAGFKEAINSAPQPLRVTLPRLFDDFDQAGVAGNIGTVGQGNVVKYYLFGPGLPSTGLLRYQGTIDKFEPSISESGQEQVTVTITPPGAAVGDNGLVGTLQMGSASATTSTTAVSPGSHTIVVASASGLVVGAYIPIDTGANLEYVTITGLSGTNLTATFAKSHSGTYSVGGGMDPVAMFLYWFTTNDPYTSLPYTQPLTLDNAGSLTSSTTLTWYTWQNQDLASIWNTIILMLRNDSPNWYWRINAAGTVTLNKTPTISPAQNVLYVGKHLAVPQYAQDWMNLRNLILVVGSTPSVSAVAQGSDLTVFNHRGYSVADTRVTTSAQATTLANGYLTALDRAIFRGQYRVVDYRGDAQVGIGYDIETMRVGQSVQIVTPHGATSANTLTWDSGLWDGGAVWGGPVSSSEDQVVQIVSISYDFDAITIETGNFGPSQDIALIKLASYLQDFSVVL